MFFHDVRIEPVLLLDNLVDVILGAPSVCVCHTAEQKVRKFVVHFDLQGSAKTYARRSEGLGGNLHALPWPELSGRFGNLCLAEIQREMNFFSVLHEIVALLRIALLRVIEAKFLASCQK